MNNDIAIKVENLSKVYKLYHAPIDRLKEALHPFKKKYHKDFYALNDVSFEINKGECVGIIGKNGSGKSTLLKIITGVLTPSAGQVSVNGRISALLELGAGFHMEYTGMENIYFQGNLMGLESEEMDNKIEEILKFADIGDFIFQPVKNYSSGMFARLAFAVAINIEPDILIVDESLSVGDANFQLKCHKRMDELRASGVTILFVSHDTYSVKTLCTKAVFLKSGMQMAYGNTIDVVNDYLLYLDSENTLLASETLPVMAATDVELISASLPAKIHNVFVSGLTKDESNVVTVKTATNLAIEVEYEIINPAIEEVVFVFNLYRERDRTYVCGTTTLMDGIPPIKVKLGTNKFKLKFSNFQLLSGTYRLRVALNEKKGLGIIAEFNDALILNCLDNHESEGLINLKREWLL